MLTLTDCPQVALWAACWMDSDQPVEALRERLVAGAADLRQRARRLKERAVRLAEVASDHPLWADRRQEAWQIRALLAEQNGTEPPPHPDTLPWLIQTAEDRLDLASFWATIDGLQATAEVAEFVANLPADNRQDMEQNLQTLYQEQENNLL